MNDAMSQNNRQIYLGLWFLNLFFRRFGTPPRTQTLWTRRSTMLRTRSVKVSLSSVWFRTQRLRLPDLRLASFSQRSRSRSGTGRATSATGASWAPSSCSSTSTCTTTSSAPLPGGNVYFSSPWLLFYLFDLFYLVTSAHVCECPVADPGAAAEEEAGSGLGRGDDRDGRQSLSAWIQLQTPTETRLQ